MNLIETKIRKVDVPILTSFLTSPIFIPLSKKEDRDSQGKRNFEIYCTKNVKIIAKVPPLDMTVDFPIWAAAVKLLNEKENLAIEIEENKFLNLIGITKTNLNNKNKKQIDKRIERMLETMIKFEYYDSNQELLKKDYINLFSKASWLKQEGRFEFNFNPDIYDSYQQIKWKAIDLDYYKGIKTEYAKALFLFYESHSNDVIPIEKNKLIERLNLSHYSRPNNITVKINQAHENLKKIGFINDYKIIKDKATKKTYYKINKVKKKDRVLGI